MHAVSDFAALPEAVRGARDFVARSLRAWSCEGLIDTAVLLTSELVTNAILHGQTGPTVRLSLQGSRLRVDVEDHGGGTPNVRQAQPEDLSGRGLALVQAMAAHWGVIEPRTPQGTKTVWFELEA